MYRNARPLDLARWQYAFEDGQADAILAALAAYQCADGGFGHALEADNWNPNASPYTTGVATDILHELNLYDAGHPIVNEILTFLADTPFRTDNDWPFTIPSNDAFPHAPWWTYSEDANKMNGFNPSATLISYIFSAANADAA